MNGPRIRFPAAAAAVVLIAATAAGVPVMPVAAELSNADMNADMAERADRAGPDSPVELVLTDIAPKKPGPASTLRVTGHLAALDSGLGGLSVRLRYSSRAFVSRGVLHAYAAGHPVRSDLLPLRDTSVDIDRDRSSQQDARKNGSADSPGATGFTLQVPVEDLGLDEFGVYPIAVEVLSEGRRIAVRRTFLPYVPENFGAQPTRIAWMWPLVDRPHRETEGIFIDDELADTLASGGRLGRLLDAATGAPSPAGKSEFPLIWAVDPALLQATADMSDGYRVRGSDSQQTSEHEESPTAHRWLDDLRKAVGDDAVVSLPYGDPDVMALHRAGLDEDLRLAITQGPSLTRDVLGRQVKQSVVWPPGGWLDQDTLDTLAVAGTETVILNGNSLSAEQTLTYTPGASTSIPTVGGTVRAFKADSTLTRVLGSASAEPGSAVLAEQRFLAETALITDELPNRARTVLVAPPRRWEPPPGFAASLLADSADVPWLQPVEFEYLREHQSEVEGSELHYSKSARRQELGQPYLKKVRRMHRELQRFAGILETRPTSFDYALLRTESSAWRDRPVLGRQLRRVVDKSLDSKRQSVRIVTSGQRVLASDSGVVPVTIANNLTEHAVTVHLELRPANRARLQVGRYEEQIRIGPEQKRTLDVRMTAATSGVTDLVAQLETPEGKDYGKPVRLEVRATGYGSAALVITGGAIAVLFLTVAARLVRRTLRSGPGQDTEEPT